MELRAIDAGTSWPNAGSSRIPASVYTDPAIYARELDRIFYGSHWSYVGLSIEVPDAGSFKRTAIGEKSVIMVRNRRGEINVLEKPVRASCHALLSRTERAGRNLGLPIPSMEL